MKQKKKNGLTLNQMLIMFALIPLTVAMVVISVFAVNTMTKNVETTTKEELVLATQSLREYYQYDIINGVDLDPETNFCAYDTEYIDLMGRETGVDFTLFKNNVRYMTTIKDNTGKRIEGTEASDAVWEAVSKGSDYYSDDVVINGIDYYVYYLPMGEKGNVIGMAFSGKPATDVQAAEKKLYIEIATIGILMEAIFLAIALFFSRKVAKPIRHVVDSIEEISQGNLKVNVDVNSNISETKLLIASAKRLVEHLMESVSGIVSKTQELVDHGANLDTASTENADNMGNLSTAIEEIANGATAMAQDVQDAAGSVSEVLVNIENINDSVSSTQDATKVMSSDSQKVVEDFDVLLKGTAVSIEKLHDISEKMNAVKQAVEKVNEAAEEINSIASQTNLLSLNASIEAARAGEAGRGFAVVAGEISSLSDQSDTAAGTIKDIMTNLETQTMDAVKSVSDLSEMMEKQGETSRKSQESLNQLIGAVESTKEQVESVKAGSDAVSLLCDRLNEIIQNLSAISEENAASAEETSASIEQVNTNTANIQGMSKELNSVSESLKDLVAYFKL